MIKVKNILVAFTVAIISFSSVVSAQNAVIKGEVKNGTTGRTTTVDKISLIGFMGASRQEIATVRNTSSFEFPNLGMSSTQPYLLITEYKGISYTASVPVMVASGVVPGDLFVYEIGDIESGISVPNGQYIFAKSGTQMQVVKYYTVNNSANSTYANDAGTFKFTVAPGGNGIEFVSVVEGQAPVTQEAFETTEPGVYAINYPLKPGNTEISISTRVDYSSSSYVYNEKQLYAISDLYIIGSPLSISIQGAGLEHRGEDEQRSLHLFGYRNISAGQLVSVIVSGGDQPQGQIMWKQNKLFDYKAMFIMFVVVILFSGSLISRNKKPQKEESKRSAMGRGAKKREKLFDDIAQLDDDFTSRKISENEYNRLRRELKSKAVENYKNAAGA